MPSSTTTSAAGSTTRDDGGGRFVVLVFDVLSAEMDAYGPMSRVDAQRHTARIADDLDAAGLRGVVVMTVRLHRSVTPPGDHRDRTT